MIKTNRGDEKMAYLTLLESSKLWMNERKEKIWAAPSLYSRIPMSRRMYAVPM